MRLVLTPAPKETECISGYLHSLTKANGYERPGRLVSHLGGGGGLVALRRVSPAVIQELTGADEETAESLSFQSKRDANRAVVWLLGQALSTREAHMSAFRICPLCVRESERHEAAWHLRIMQWCPLHRIRLLDSCAECTKKLAWNRSEVGRCKCGADLTSQVGSEHCSDALATLLQALRAALYRDPAVLCCPDDMAHLAHLDLFSFSRLLYVLCGELSGENPYASASVTARLPERLEDVAHILINWPHNFREFLKQRYEKVLVDGRGEAPLRKTFRWALISLGKNLGDKRRLFDFLIAEIHRFGAQFMSRERVVRRRWVDVPLEFAWGSIADAAAIADIDARTMVRRIQCWGIPTIRLRQVDGPRSVLVDLDWVRRWKRNSGAHFNPRNVAAKLGISYRLLQKLREDGLFKETFRSRSRRSLDEVDIQSFARSLSRVIEACSVDGTAGGIKLDRSTLRSTKSLDVQAAGLRELFEKHAGQ